MTKEQFIDGKYFDIAKVIASRSSCVKRKVGCVIVNDDRIISTGYNGTPSGYVNCDLRFNAESFDADKHRAWVDAVEIHAEQNAVAILAKYGIRCDGSVCYVTLQPCPSCLLLLIACGIRTIKYLKHKEDYCVDTMNMINTLGITVKQFDYGRD